MPKFVITYFAGSPTGTGQTIEAHSYKLHEDWINFTDERNTVIASIASKMVARIERKEE